MGTDHQEAAPNERALVPVGQVRASDAEREAVVTRLHAALGEGRLDMDETERRAAAAYACCYRAELAPLTADLPTPEPETPGGWAVVWRAVAGELWRWWSRLTGGTPAEPTPSQRRATSIAVLAGLVLALFCLFAGFMAGLG